MGNLGVVPQEEVEAPSRCTATKHPWRSIDPELQTRPVSSSRHSIIGVPRSLLDTSQEGNASMKRSHILTMTRISSWSTNTSRMNQILSSHQSQASRHHTWIMICRTHKDLICERLHQLNREIDLKSFISWDSKSYRIDSLISLCLIKVPMMGSLSRVARWNRVWYQGNNQV